MHNNKWSGVLSKNKFVTISSSFYVLWLKSFRFVGIFEPFGPLNPISQNEKKMTNIASFEYFVQSP